MKWIGKFQALSLKKRVFIKVGIETILIIVLFFWMTLWNPTLIHWVAAAWLGRSVMQVAAAAFDVGQEERKRG